MKPLLVLLIVFFLSICTMKIGTNGYDAALAGRIAMSAMLAFTAIAHYTLAKGMVMMIPEKIPFRLQLVYLTGVMEIAAAVTLLIPSLKVLTAWFLICFFILIIPANINAAFKKIDYQKGTYDGSGPAYLWFRVPLQIFFIAWVYFCAIKH